MVKINLQKEKFSSKLSCKKQIEADESSSLPGLASIRFIFTEYVTRR